MYVEFTAEDFRTRVQFSPPPLLNVDKIILSLKGADAARRKGWAVCPLFHDTMRPSND
jgi:hypothetical protein